MRAILKRAVLGMVILVCAIYVADDLSVRHRRSAGRDGDPFDVLVSPHILEIPHKGTKVEYAVDVTAPVLSQPCVHSLFPHSGYLPCWYIKRERQGPTPMAILPLFRLL
jgi:hypothetical protein